MQRSVWVLAAVLLAIPGCFGDAPTPTNTYPALQSSPIRGLTPEEIRGLESGEGMGYALPAELNGYPGPKHVLELREELSLSDDQESRVIAVRADMLRQAKATGAELLAAYRDLDDAFRNQSITAESLRAITTTIGEREAQLRAIHMEAHLETLAILTHAQVQTYIELRGYDASAHTQHSQH